MATTGVLVGLLSISLLGSPPKKELAFQFAPLTACPGLNGVGETCVLGQFKKGLPVRIAGDACTPTTDGPALWSHPDEEMPKGQVDIETRLLSGAVQRATKLKGAEACCRGDVALVGFGGTLLAGKVVPVTDAALRERLASTARTATETRDVIRRDSNYPAAVLDPEPIEVFQVEGKGPVFVRFRSKAANTLDGPMVVFQEGKLTTPFALCVDKPQVFIAGGRVFFRTVHGLCDSGGVLVEAYEVQGERLVQVMSTNIYAD